MNEGSTVLLYLLFGIPALYVGLVLLSMGPSGWFVAAFLTIALIAAKTWGDDESTGSGVERTNCPECGAPNPTDGDECGYCEAPLPEP